MNDEMISKVDMFDQQIAVGDLCARIYHYNTLKIASVQSLGEQRVVFANGGRGDYDTVISLTAMGIKDVSGFYKSTHCAEEFKDALGNTLHVGDIVLYLMTDGAFFAKGVVLKTSDKKVRISQICNQQSVPVINNRFYSDVISLSAYKLENLEIKEPHWARE